MQFDTPRLAQKTKWISGMTACRFMNTSTYYGSYTDTSVDSTSVPKPNVDASLAPPGCNIFKQFGIANYSGPLPCNITVSSASVGNGSSASSNACVVWLHCPILQSMWQAFCIL